MARKRKWKKESCVKCGATENLTKDHVVPQWFTGSVIKYFGFRIKSGSMRRRYGFELTRFETLCQKCNLKKGGKIEYNNPVVRAYLSMFIENVQDIIDIHES